MSGGWVRRVDAPKPHHCAMPMRDVFLKIKKHGMMSPNDETVDTKFGEEPAGNIGDLWRCRCRRLWRIARRPMSKPGLGPAMWRRATLWQRFRFPASADIGRGFGIEPVRVPVPPPPPPVARKVLSGLSRESNDGSAERTTDG